MTALKWMDAVSLPMVPSLDFTSHTVLEYSEKIGAINSSLRDLLCLKEPLFIQLCKKTRFQSSIAPFLLGLLAQKCETDSSEIGKTVNEDDWQLDYALMTRGEMFNKSLCLLGRILEVGEATGFLIRSVDLPVWIDLIEIAPEEYQPVAMSLVCRLLESSPLYHGQLVKFVRGIALNAVSPIDGKSLLTLISLMRVVKQDTLSLAEGTNLLIMIGAIQELELVPAILKYLQQSLCFTCLVPEDVAQSLVDTAKHKDLSPTIRLLPDMIQSIDGLTTWLKAFGSALDRALILEEKLKEITEALPRVSLDEAGRALTKADGNVSFAIELLQNPKSKSRNQFAVVSRDEEMEFLNQKSAEMVASIVDKYLYEDELVDTFEGDGPATGDLSQSKNSDGLSDLDRKLIEAYIANPKLFERGAAMRATPARLNLCRELSLDHEQIEGWALMLERNPRKDIILSDYQLLHPQSRNTQASSSMIAPKESQNRSKQRGEKDQQKPNKGKGKDKKDNLNNDMANAKHDKDRNSQATKSKSSSNQGEVKKTMKKIYKTSSTSQQPTDSRQPKGSE